MQSSALAQFSPCDVADALVKLQCHPGFLPGIKLTAGASTERLVGPAMTVQMVHVSDTDAPAAPPGYYLDAAPAGSVIVIQTPPDAVNAVWGGLMATRAQHLGVKGAVIDGNCRDLDELDAMRFPVYARGVSCLGAATFTRVSCVNSPLTLAFSGKYSPVTVNPGDWIVADRDGAVVVPADKVDQVVAMCQKLVDADAKCLQDLREGHSIQQTFQRHRGK